jgi:putative cell wall-binding protein
MSTLKNKILIIYKKNSNLSVEQIHKLIPCSLRYAEFVIREFKKDNPNYIPKVIERKSDLYLETSIGFKDKGLYFLFTKISEKTLKIKKFNILNPEIFSKIELEWLKDNYNFI